MEERTTVPIHSIQKKDVECKIYTCDVKDCKNKETFIANANGYFDDEMNEWFKIYKIAHKTINLMICPECMEKIFELDLNEIFGKNC